MSTCSETLPDRVKQYICTKYHKEYLGSLTYKVTALEGTPNSLYYLAWGLNQETYPFVMQGEYIDEDHFYDYVTKQIAITKFYDTKRFIAYRVSPPAFIDPEFIDPLLIFDKEHPNT